MVRLAHANRALLGFGVGLGVGVLSSYLRRRPHSIISTADRPVGKPGGKFVTVAGVRLHYIERGTGPALVLLDGKGLSSTQVELGSLLARAAEDYRVIAFDRPGFGFSDRPPPTHWSTTQQADLLHDALRALDCEHAIIVGHGRGTLVAMELAELVPDFVRGLVLVAGKYYPSIHALARHETRLKVPVRIIAGTQDDLSLCSDEEQATAVLAAIEAMATEVGVPPVLHDPAAEALARASESGV